MLVELAVGDAYGAGFEYADPVAVARDNDLMRYVKHPRHRIISGRYTDDTQMSIAIAEAIVEDLPWTPLALAEKCVATFKRDPREGYAARFYDFLRGVNSGEEFLREIEPTSEKSGAAMRAAPIGVFPTVAEVIARYRPGTHYARHSRRHQRRSRRRPDGPLLPLSPRPQTRAGSLPRSACPR